MNATERRQAHNARLREKVNQIQSLSQALTDSLGQLETQTLQWVRQHDAVDLPAQELSQALSAPLREMHQALTQLKKQTVGNAEASPARSLSPEELTALLKE